ncbi:polysaccharide deacetylase family protein [Pedobacter sp. UC225_61]|uniref:polysaccharide deacetylase family protein n=1 Tax=Pedobacter sp. UC225_61 TaxID=3374623 RepID=UPI0037ADDAA0
MQLLIYTPKVTPRIKYTFNFIFREILHCDFEFTSVAADFSTSHLPKISYTDIPLRDELFFTCSSFLTKHNIEPITIKETLFGDQKVPFPVENGALPFDIFAASFYFLSRYEEYLPFEADEHQRYPATQSLQYKLDVLKIPVIDSWALLLKNILLKKFPTLTFRKRKFEFIPTIDVDRAYHFRSSGILKNTVRFFKAALKLNTEKIANLISTGLGQDDPFDTYEYLADIHAQYNLRAIFFFLLAKQGHEEFDQNIDPEDEVFKNLISNVSQIAQIGLHPSYASTTETKKISEELVRLQEIAQKRIDTSRQHFLKLSFPQTYLQLIKAGINHDYSMGYASQIGFRAGTCTSFFWYDLQLEKQTHLKIHPFAVMDVTLQQYLKLNPLEAISKIEELILSVKLVDGTFCSLWHNESLSETGKWKGWKTVYDEMLKNSLN